MTGETTNNGNGEGEAEAAANQGGGRQPIAFISHHSSQEQTARHLKEILERNGITGWMAPDDIEPGRPFDQAIIEEVEECDLIVLLFCSQSDQSRHVKRELMMAENHNKLIYPVRLEDIDAKGLAYWLNDYQWIDWIDQRDATIQNLVDAIKRQVSGVSGDTKPPAGAAPPPPAAPASEPVPADAAPMALAGTADADGGSASGKSGLSAGSWGVIGAVAIIAVIATGIALTAGGGEAAGETALEPGNWETSMEFIGVEAPDFPPDARRILREQMATSETTTTECLSEDQAADPGGSFIDDLQLTSDCQITRSRWIDGEIDVLANCTDPDSGLEAEMTMEGQYNRTQMIAEIDVAIDTEIGPINAEMVIRSSRLGECG